MSKKEENKGPEELFDKIPELGDDSTEGILVSAEPNFEPEQEPEYLKKSHFEREHKKSLGKQLVGGLVAIIVIGGLVWLFALSPYFFYRQTSSNIEQPKLEQIVSGQNIVIPLSAVVVLIEGFEDSVRDRENIERMVRNASNIWVQAGINLELESYEQIILSKEQQQFSRRSPQEFIATLQPQGTGSITVFFTKDLAGINGIAYLGPEQEKRKIALADHTATFDFRVLAHEIGHVMGLGHVNDKSNIMSSGATGVKLSIEQAWAARLAAEQY